MVNYISGSGDDGFVCLMNESDDRVMMQNCVCCIRNIVPFHVLRK